MSIALHTIILAACTAATANDGDDDLCLFFITLNGKSKWSSDRSCPVIFSLNFTYEFLSENAEDACDHRAIFSF